jgi:hypothetical protein
VLAVAGGAAAILLMMVAQPPFRGVDWLMRVAAPTGPMNANRREVEAEYVNIMRIPVKQGRVFDRRDTASSDAVAIVSQSFAALRFRGQSALGQTLDLSPAPSRTIVGVGGDVRHERIDQAAAPAFYLPRSQAPSELICLVVRTAPSVVGVPAAIRAPIASIDPRQPVEGVTTLDRIAADSIADRRFYALATSALALTGLVLAVAGLFGVVSRSVSERVRELAIRQVLGARRAALIQMVLRRGLISIVGPDRHRIAPSGAFGCFLHDGCRRCGDRVNGPDRSDVAADRRPVSRSARRVVEGR